jgi:hypothetical protein
MFELFDNVADALAMTPSKSIFIVAPTNRLGKGPYDLRRARVSGVVDATNHGVLGYRCALAPKQIDVLSGPVAPWPDVVGVFRNETNVTITLRFGVGSTESTFAVRPSDFVETRGWARNERVTTVQALSPSGSLIAKMQIAIERRGPYYDSTNAASYYRIKDGKVEIVPPGSTKNWGWRR